MHQQEYSLRCSPLSASDELRERCRTGDWPTSRAHDQREHEQTARIVQGGAVLHPRPAHPLPSSQELLTRSIFTSSDFDWATRLPGSSY